MLGWGPVSGQKEKGQDVEEVAFPWTDGRLAVGTKEVRPGGIRWERGQDQGGSTSRLYWRPPGKSFTLYVC